MQPNLKPKSKYPANHLFQIVSQKHDNTIVQRLENRFNNAKKLNTTIYNKTNQEWHNTQETPS